MAESRGRPHVFTYQLIIIDTYTGSLCAKESSVQLIDSVLIRPQGGLCY